MKEAPHSRADLMSVHPNAAPKEKLFLTTGEGESKVLLFKSFKTGFSTLVGHFSKLFEFAGLSRLKIPIFVPKSGCSLKKKRSSLGIGL